jgi:hypothetical protein
VNPNPGFADFLDGPRSPQIAAMIMSLKMTMAPSPI